PKPDPPHAPVPDSAFSADATVEYAPLAAGMSVGGGLATSAAAPPERPPPPDAPRGVQGIWRRATARVFIVGFGGLLLVALIAGSVEAAVATHQRDDLKIQAASLTRQRDQARRSLAAADAESRSNTRQMQGKIDDANHRAATAETRALSDAKAKLAQQVHDTGVKLDARKSALDARQHAIDSRSQQLDGQAAQLAAAEGQLHANTISGDGVYGVGSDMQPGVWHTAGTGGDNCYYAVLNSTDTSDIADNDNTIGPATVTLRAGNYFDVDGCADWVKVG
ncbi:MAG TPA: hypothetical protein VGI86_02185, partial [Acidimicrobiia bacterium]